MLFSIPSFFSFLPSFSSPLLLALRGLPHKGGLNLAPFSFLLSPSSPLSPPVHSLPRESSLPPFLLLVVLFRTSGQKKQNRRHFPLSFLGPSLPASAEMISFFFPLFFPSEHIPIYRARKLGSALPLLLFHYFPVCLVEERRLLFSPPPPRLSFLIHNSAT